MESEFSRVAVVGTTCAGKSTFAEAFAKRLGHKHIELDELFWLPDWQTQPADVFLNSVRHAVSTNRWVVDGNYSQSRDAIWSRATAIIWLNYPFPVVFGRGLKRTIFRTFSGREVCNGNHETFHKTFFSRDSILLWLVSSFSANRQHYRTLFEGDDWPDLTIIELKAPVDARNFLKRLEA